MIDQIRVDAALRAEIAAKLEINRILKDEKRIEELIELAIENRVFERLDLYADTLEKDLKELVGIVSEFILAVDRIRRGNRATLVHLHSIGQYTTDNFIKKLVTFTIDEKIQDYVDFEDQVANALRKGHTEFLDTTSLDFICKIDFVS